MNKHNGPKYDAAYMRYSSENQRDNTSIDVQREIIARAIGGKFVEYIDEARSATTVAGRENFELLLADAEAGRINRIFVLNWSRFGRDRELHSIAGQIDDLNIPLISCSEGSDPMTRGISLVVAAETNRRMGQNVKLSLARRFRERQWTGGNPPWGFKVIGEFRKRKLAIHEDEAKIVHQIFNWYLSESIGVKAIADRLRTMKIATRRGADWNFTSVRGILTNQALTGTMSYNRRKYKRNRERGIRGGNRNYKWNDQAEHLTYHDPALQIIDQETFDRVQAKFAERTANRKQSPVAARQIRPLTGLVYCGVCNSVCYAQKDGRTGRHYYGCACRARKGPNACVNASKLREDQLLAEINEAFGLLIGAADDTIKAIVAEADRTTAVNRDHGQQLQRDIAAQEKVIAGLQRCMVDPDLLDNPDAKRSVFRQLGEAEAKRDELRNAVAKLGHQATDDANARLQEAKNLFEDMRSCFNQQSSPAEIHRFIEDFVGPFRVMVDGSTEPLTQTAPAKAEAVLTGNVAPTRFDTGRKAIRQAFWGLKVPFTHVGNQINGLGQGQMPTAFVGHG